ncbi:MAG: acetylglutamate kinase [Ferruginibacter sp.]|nr:acetylglutamate kinase [Ferruginibacter sp.]
MQQLIVVKIGGNIIDDAVALESFIEKFAAIDAPKILIHGGGKLATEMATTLHIPQQMIEGRRITDEATLKIVTMVYAGFINKNLVAKLHAKTCNAIGLCGADANIILAKKRTTKEIDYGFVGDVIADGINVNFLKLLLENNTTPIIAPLTHNGNGQLLNTNADTIANEIAKAMSTHYQVQLIYCFDKKGVLQNIADENSVIKLITKENIETLKANKTIHEGMIPKIDNALQAVASGVYKVVLGHALDLNKIMKGEAGTVIK